VTGAHLSLFTDSASNGYPITLSACQVLRPWTETEATWINAGSDNRWTIPGANGRGSDCSVLSTAALTVSTMGDWYDLDATSMVAAWVGSPDSNFGLSIKGLPGPDVSYDFISSQYQFAQGASLRPRLTVGYVLPPGPTPTATSTRTPTATRTRMYTYLPVILSSLVTIAPAPTGTATPTATPEAIATEPTTKLISTATATADSVLVAVFFR
jgi:hypothetical protein